MSTPAIARHIGNSPTDPERLEEWRRRAWLYQGVAVIPLDAVADPFERQTLKNVMERMYGKRRGDEA